MPLFAGRAKASVENNRKKCLQRRVPTSQCALETEKRSPPCVMRFTPSEPGRHQALMIDLEETASLPSAFDSAVESFGPVHILINNAGGPPGGPLLANGVPADFEAPFEAIFTQPTPSYNTPPRPWNRKDLEELSKSSRPR